MFVRKAGLVRSLGRHRGGSKVHIDNWQWSTSECTSAVMRNRSDILPSSTSSYGSWSKQMTHFIILSGSVLHSIYFIDSLFIFLDCCECFPNVSFLSISFLFLSTLLLDCSNYHLGSEVCLTANAHFSLPVFFYLFSLTVTEEFVCVLLLLGYSHIFEFLLFQINHVTLWNFDSSYKIFWVKSTSKMYTVEYHLGDKIIVQDY